LEKILVSCGWRLKAKFHHSIEVTSAIEHDPGAQACRLSQNETRETEERARFVIPCEASLGAAAKRLDARWEKTVACLRDWYFWDPMQWCEKATDEMTEAFPAIACLDKVLYNSVGKHLNQLLF